MATFKPADYYPGFRGHDIDMDGVEVLNAGDPTAAQSLATKNYVDTELAAAAVEAHPTYAVKTTDVDPLLKVATVTLADTDILALNATPKQLIAAPGAGASVIVERVAFRFNWATTQYAAGGACSVFYSGASTNLMAATLAATFFTAPTGAVTNDVAIGPSASALTIPQNTAVVLKAASADFTTGDSTVDVTIWYRVV